MICLICPKVWEIPVVTTFFWEKKNTSDFCILPKALPTSFAGSEKWPLESNIRSGVCFGESFLWYKSGHLKKVNIYIYIYLFGTYMFICMCAYIPLHICVYIYTQLHSDVYIYTHIFICIHIYEPPPQVGGSSTYVASWICQSRPKLGWWLCTKMDSETLSLWQVSMFRKY